MNRNLTVVIDGNIAGFDRAINQAVSGLSNFASKAQQIGTALSLSVSAPLGVLAKKSVDAYRELDSLTRGLATVEKDASSLASRLSLLQDVAKLPGLSFTGAIEGDLRLRTVFNTMLDGEKAARLSERTIRAFGNALASVGKGGTDFREVSNQLTQLLGSGKLQGDELRVISERVPQARNAILAAFGTLDTKLINSKYNAVQVVEGIITQLEKLPKASGGVNNAFENFSDSSFRAFAKLGQIIDQSAGLTNLIDGMSNAITSLVDKFASLPPTTQTVVVGIAALAVTVPPLLATLGVLTGTVLPAIKAGFLAISGPIGLAVVAITAAVAAIIVHWDEMKAALLESNLWDTLKSLAENGLGLVTSVFGVFANLIQGDWSNLWEHLKNVLKYAWNGIIDVVATGVLTIGRHLGKLFSTVGLDSWAKKVETRMNEVFLTAQSRQFVIQSPKVNTDLFSGLNFGGKSNPTAKPTIDTSDLNKKTKQAESFLDFLKRRIRELEAQVQDFSLRNLKVPDDVINSLSAFTGLVKKAEEALSALKPIDLGNLLKSLKSKGDFSSALPNPEAPSAPQLPGLDNFNKTFVKQAQANIAAVEQYKEKVSDSIAGIPGIFGGLRSGLQKMAENDPFNTKGWMEKAEALADGMKITLANVKMALVEGAFTAMEGFGEALGKGANVLDSGKKAMKEVLTGIINLIADQAIAIGKALLIAGAALVFTGVGTAEGLKDIAAGTGLIVAGGVVKGLAATAFKGYESGGLFTGESLIRVGESTKARMGGGEFVSPVNKGANLIGDRIMDNLVSALPSMRSLPSGYSPEKTLQLEINGELTAHGQSLRLALSRANVSSKVFGNG